MIINCEFRQYRLLDSEVLTSGKYLMKFDFGFKHLGYIILIFFFFFFFFLISEKIVTSLPLHAFYL